MSIFHTLPLDRSQVFEVAACGQGWTHDHSEMPHCRAWNPVAHGKAIEMIHRAHKQLREGKPARRFVINFGSCVHGIFNIRYSMYHNGFQLPYTFLSERNGVYHFGNKYFNNELSWMQEVLVREAHTLVLNVTVLRGGGGKIIVENMAGATVLEYTGRIGESLRASELRHMVRMRLVVDDKITRVSHIKLVMRGEHNVLRGNRMLINNVRQQIPPRRVRKLPHRKLPHGQSVITQYFGR